MIEDIIFDEYTTAKTNKNEEIEDFEAIQDMLEGIRSEKDYEWMSDVNYPLYSSIVNTEASTWAQSYFVSRDFVNVYLQNSDELSIIKSEAIKDNINTQLNIRDVYFYPKYIRARLINSMIGYVYALCWWDKKTRSEKVGESTYYEETEDGLVEKTEDQTEEVVVKDHFNFDVYDPRNVFEDDELCYTAQKKKWIIFRDEVSYEELVALKETNGYKNLKDVKKLIPEDVTETARESYNSNLNNNKPSKTPIKKFDRLRRFGTFWAVRTKKGIEPGYDDNGVPKDDAELIETITELVVKGNQKILIRFQETPFVDSFGEPYKPVIKGLCYIHPTKDKGISDGKYDRDLQRALNDTINMSNDRTRLSAFPTFKGRRYAIEENEEIYIEPEHIIPLEDPVNDLVELQVRDNINGALNQANLFIQGMQQSHAIYPTTMGDMPSVASTTATAVAGAAQNTNIRNNYKNLTFEYTFLTELYWMINQMTYRFMSPETAMAIMQDKAQYFDPNGNYSYQPLSQNIEAEYNKLKKVSAYDQLLGRLSAFQGHPKLMPIISRIIGRQMSLMGDEFQGLESMLSELGSMPMPQEQTMEEQPSDMEQGVSNQYGIPISAQEEMVR